MAERRMFSKTIIDSDDFLELPLSTQALYFHLAMRADDDGFVNSPKKILRMIGAAAEDMKLLEEQNFVLPFESGVVVIKHWKIHNYIRNDRYKETLYTDEKSQLRQEQSGAYTLNQDSGIPLVYQTDTQYSIAKDRVKGSIGESSNSNIDSLNNIHTHEKETSQANTRISVCDYNEYKNIYNSVCTHLPKLEMMTDKRKKAAQSFSQIFTMDQFREICKKANNSDFLTGKTSSNSWRADFGYLINPDNAAKILEGGFDCVKNNREFEKWN